MVTHWMARLACVVAASGVAACDMPPPVLTPQGESVQVRKADPPDGATDLGSITAYDGSGCGALTSNGTFENAVVRIRNEAARRGGNYVEMVTTIGPHLEGDCQSNTFTLIGRLFRVSTKVAPPLRAARVEVCDPPCSPGYACESGACRALCNPPCDDGKVCRQDRTCGPSESASP